LRRKAATGAERDRLPDKSLLAQGEDIALLVSRQEENQRLAGAKEFLYLRWFQWFGVRERGVLGKFLFESTADGRDPYLVVGNVLAQHFDRRAVPLALRLRKLIKQPFVFITPCCGEVLALAYQGGKRAIARRKPRRHLP
jgi:hypothetical protein